MIVEGWIELHKAIDEAVPCDSPMPSGPYGDDARCGDCEQCKRFDLVEQMLMAVEDNIEDDLVKAGGRVL